MTHEPSTSLFGSGSGTQRSYSVEIRSTSSEPKVLPCGQIVDREWRRVPVQVVRCDRPDHAFTLAEANGIPVQNFCHVADDLNLMDFHAAYAFMATLLAQANNGARPLGALCLETRMVEVEVKHSFEATVKRTGDPLNIFTMQRGTIWEDNK